MYWMKTIWVKETGRRELSFLRHQKQNFNVFKSFMSERKPIYVGPTEFWNFWLIFQFSISCLTESRKLMVWGRTGRVWKNDHPAGLQGRGRKPPRQGPHRQRQSLTVLWRNGKFTGKHFPDSNIYLDFLVLGRHEDIWKLSLFVRN